MTHSLFNSYSRDLCTLMEGMDWSVLEPVADLLWDAWQRDANIFICGNGGSAGNAIHLANDFIWGAAPDSGHAMRVQALPANASIVTCMGNDIGYERIFSEQIRVLGGKGDVLIVMSGSGNSANIVNAVMLAQQMGVATVGLLGFQGGKCLELVDHPVHFPIDDMQISEDMQQVVGHMLTRWLNERYLASAKAQASYGQKASSHRK